MIELTNIGMKYNTGKENEVHALKNITLTVHKGEFIAMTGASGSGKSTLLQILGGFLRPTSGEYINDGNSIPQLNDRDLAHFRNERIGFVLQDYGLLQDRNVLENVCMPMMFSRIKWGQIEKRAITILEKVGIGHLKARRINQLSGGQCQLVAVARAIVMQPPLILADEPTGSLDSDSAKHLMEIFSNLNKQGQTIIMVTHNMDLCKWCSRNIKIADGMIE